MGGVGAVSRVHDHRLGRVVARKSLRAEVQARPPAVARFIEEAQATAQL
jgi:serine/threonine protein kinase